VRLSLHARYPSLLVPVHFAVIGLFILGIALLIVTQSYEAAGNQNLLTVASGLVLLALVFYARYALGFPWLSASLMYLILLWVFHFGLSFPAALDPGVLATMQEWEVAWLFAPAARLAMLLATLGGAAFVAGAALFAPRGGHAARETPHEGVRVLRLVGWTLMVAGMAGSMFFLARYGGTGLFSISYVELMATVMEETRMRLAMDAAQLGCLLAICGAEPARALRPLLAWAPFGVVLLILGFRTDAIVPAAAYTIVLAHRGVHLPRGLLISGLLAFLVVIPVIRNLRTVGFEHRSELSWEEVSPLGTFTEFGSTLRAAAVYIDWIEGGEDFQMGAGYWAPIDRQVLGRLMPWRGVPPYETDPRIPQRNIQTVGAIGLSATGEAYYNLGAFGPFLFYGCIGVLFGWLDRHAGASPYRAAMLGIAMLVLFFNIRGAWLPVPARIVVGLMILAVCHVLGRPKRAHARSDALSSAA
jgi:hypothetical protein